MTDCKPLKEQTVLFTGKLACGNRRQAHALVKAAGGMPVDNLSKKVTLVVVGMLGWALLADGKVSEKLLKAEALQQNGQALEIISEAEFLRRIGEQSNDLRPWQASGSVTQAAQLLHVDETLIRRWTQFGLIQVKDDQVDFQDLVSLRAIAKLIQDGLSTKQLARALSELNRVVPDLHRPFAQARILHENGDAVVVELQGTRMDTHGQLLLDFEAQQAAVPQTLEQRGEALEEAWQCIEEGLDFEETQNWPAAQQSYQQALQLAPDHAEAHFYLANVFRTQQQYLPAVEHYQQAVALDAGFADAMYNLAYTWEELDKTDQAMEAFKKTIAMDGQYADAYFSLARLLVRTGKSGEAVEYWKQYLQFDQASDWAKIAKRQITCHNLCGE